MSRALLRLRFDRQGQRLSALAVVLAAIFLLMPGAAQAQDFPSEPILRLETGTHTAPVRAIAVDRDERLLVTASHDKTVRVWDLDSGRPLSVLRVPIAPGDAGKVYCVAISPDGTTIAASGWMTPSAGDVIYVMDQRSSRILTRVTGLPNVVHHLAFSADGQYLAAALGGRNGIRVYETKAFTEIARDKDYGDSVYGAHFDRRNRLVTASYDGYVRLYDMTARPFEPVTKVEPAPGTRPYSVAFSPDGSRIAVGYRNSTRVDVLSGHDLHLLSSANPSGEGGDFSTVAWSRDGRYLYAAGQHNRPGTDQNVIRRWSEAGRGESRDFTVSDNTVMDLVSLADGRLAVGAQDPLVALLDVQGKAIWVHERGVSDFRRQVGAKALRLSRTAEVVTFGFTTGSGDRVRFSLTEATLERDPPEDPNLAGPTTESASLRVTDWENAYNPKLNGKALRLERFERSQSLAIAPGGQQFLLGTVWHLRYFRKDGSQIWKTDAPGTAWSVNIAGNGKVAVAGFGDGTLRWYRLKDGKELLAFFADPKSERWIAWTPEGYYHASAGAEDLIGWHINRGGTEKPEFFGASRFRDQFSRPDVIARVLKTLDVAEALAQADKERGQRTTTRDVRALRPPVISILAPAPNAPVHQNQMTLSYRVESPTGPVIDVQARVDGRPARVLEYHPGEIGQITVSLPARNSTVSLIARNDNGPSEPADFVVNWQGTPDWYKPSLYVLAIGVSQYRDDGITDLRFAHQDALDFVSEIKGQEGGLYQKVSARILTNEKATRDAILDGLDWLLHESSPRDVAILFIAGHGMKDPADGKYRFLPYDTDISRLRRTTLKDSDFKEFLGAVPAKTLMFSDTCHSGSVLSGRRADTTPDIDSFASELADTQAGVVVFSSSTGRQLSQEDPTWQNGAFTEALIDAIKQGVADFTRDSYVSIGELEVYLSDRVKKLTGGNQKPVTAKPEAIENFNVIHVTQLR